MLFLYNLAHQSLFVYRSITIRHHKTHCFQQRFFYLLYLLLRLENQDNFYRILVCSNTDIYIFLLKKPVLTFLPFAVFSLATHLNYCKNAGYSNNLQEKVFLCAFVILLPSDNFLQFLYCSARLKYFVQAIS